MSTTTMPVNDPANEFYRQYFDAVIFILMIGIVLTIAMAFVILYQISHRPLPTFTAISPNGQHLDLRANTTPNLSSTTITRWARKAAITAYTFNFVNYNKQLSLARPYFTPAGWGDYMGSLANLLQTIKQNQLFVNGIVLNPPVISNQGDLPGEDFAWRVQIPFLVIYQTAEESSSKKLMVLMSIVRVPTTTDPSGIGISQFIMR